MFGKYFVAALAVAAAALAQGVVNSPAVIIQCQPVQLSWTIPGTVFLSIIPGGQPSAAPLVDFGSQAASPYTWTPALAAGTSITIRAINSDGAPFYSSPISIQAGSTTNCAAAASVSSGASSAAGSATSAVVGATSSAASAVSSASAVASSGVSSASMMVSSASSAASSARASASNAVSSVVASASAAASSAAASVSNRVSSAAGGASNSVTSAAAAATSTGAATKLQVGGVGAVLLGFIGALAI